MLQERTKPLEIDAKYQNLIKTEDKVVKIDAEGLYYKELNCLLRQVITTDVERIELHNVCGQRYLGTDLDTKIQIEVYGTPGNDLGAFMCGPKMVIHGNAQDASGNTMNEGQIIVHGHAGDLTGHSMRGGKIFIKDYVGYRVGIHMKEYQRKIPQIVIGETAGDFLAEYMAGGVILILGLNLKEGEKCVAKSLAQECTAESSMNAAISLNLNQEPKLYLWVNATCKSSQAWSTNTAVTLVQIPKQSCLANSTRYCHSQNDPTKNYTLTKIQLLFLFFV